MNFIWLVAQRGATRRGAAQRGAARLGAARLDGRTSERYGAQITTGARRAGNLIGLNYCLGSSAAPPIID